MGTMWLHAACNLALVAVVMATTYTQPEQVHIALGEEAGSMSVTWTTQSSTNSSTVLYGITNITNTLHGTMSKFVQGGQSKRTTYVHRALLKNLKPTVEYKYVVGDASAGWSNTFFFKMPRTDPNWSPRIALVGDMGSDNARSLPRIQQQTVRGQIDAVFHIGDFAYDLDSNNGLNGDQFMRQIEPIAAYIPYMTTPGNHEYYYNFSSYRARFTMPKANGDGEGIFYSYDFGPAHFISFSSEVFFYIRFGFQQIFHQRAWLEKDLQKANANRKERPWIITMAHRPAVCSNSDGDDCTKYRGVTRLMTEDLFYKYGVDVQLWAHEHSYERLWPQYNFTVCNGTKAPNDNPSAPLHIITGSAGCREIHDHFQPVRPPWSAFRSDDYGYTMMQIHNATHLTMDQISDDKDGAVIDHVTLIRNKHEAGMYTCHKQPLQWSEERHRALMREQNRRKAQWLKQRKQQDSHPPDWQ